MDREGFDALVLTQEEPVRYLSGYNSVIWAVGRWLPTVFVAARDPRQAVLICSAFDAGCAAGTSWAGPSTPTGTPDGAARDRSPATWRRSAPARTGPASSSVPGSVHGAAAVRGHPILAAGAAQRLAAAGRAARRRPADLRAADAQEPAGDRADPPLGERGGGRLPGRPGGGAARG